ncbi:MAG: hypothetical protein K9J74_06735 [Sulfuritalea sp.]|nr:hypothetical protein [Sulfuritalea sp.]
MESRQAGEHGALTSAVQFTKVGAGGTARKLGAGDTATRRPEQLFAAHHVTDS